MRTSESFPLTSKAHLDGLAEVEAFRSEICSFITAELTEKTQLEQRDPRQHNGWSAEFSAAFRRRLGERGFLDQGWPPEFGGRGARFQLVLNEELQYHLAPGVDPTATYVPSVLMAFGTPEQQELFLPRLRSGEVYFFIGYSEPEAGSDLASLKTSATEDDTGFILTGQKMYSSYADRADFGLVIARSDPESERGQGLTLFIVDMREPGVRIAEHETIGGWIHHSVYFDHVHVPREMVVGGVHEGWPVVIGAIDFERATIAQPGRLDRQLDRLVAHARALHEDGSRPLDNDRTCDCIVGLAVEIEAARLYCHSLFRRDVPGHAGSLAALLGNEAVRAADVVGLEQLGLHSQLRGDSEYAPFRGAVEHEYREHVVVQFAAGGFDVTRNILATRALAMRSRAGGDSEARPNAELPRLLADVELDASRRTILADVARTAEEFAGREARRVGRSAAFDPAQWREMTDLGWAGAVIPEELGGLGAGLAPVALIVEACGAEGLITPLVDCGVGAGTLVGAADDEQRLRWLEPLAAGSIVVAPALHEAGVEFSARTMLRKNGSGFVLVGTKLFVRYAAEADEIICLCRIGDATGDVGLAIVPARAPGVELTLMPTTNDDPQYVVRFSDVAVDGDRVVALGLQASQALSAAVDRCAVATAAELLGIGRSALALTLSYVQERVQFGRSLARFQAVEHHCVDMYRDLEQTRILTEEAVLRLDQGLDAERAASLAKVKAAEAVGAVLRTAHQLHGGIGYYTDYPLELLYRRSMRAQAAWGSSSWHRSRLASLVRGDVGRFRRDGAHPLPATARKGAA